MIKNEIKSVLSKSTLTHFTKTVEDKNETIIRTHFQYLKVLEPLQNAELIGLTILVT